MAVGTVSLRKRAAVGAAGGAGGRVWVAARASLRAYCPPPPLSPPPPTPAARTSDRCRAVGLPHHLLPHALVEPRAKRVGQPRPLKSQAQGKRNEQRASGVQRGDQ